MYKGSLCSGVQHSFCDFPLYFHWYIDEFVAGRVDWDFGQAAILPQVFDEVLDTTFFSACVSSDGWTLFFAGVGVSW